MLLARGRSQKWLSEPYQMVHVALADTPFLTLTCLAQSSPYTYPILTSILQGFALRLRRESKEYKYKVIVESCELPFLQEVVFQAVLEETFAALRQHSGHSGIQEWGLLLLSTSTQVTAGSHF